MLNRNIFVTIDINILPQRLGYNTVHYEQNRTLTTLETILLTGLPQDWFIPLWAKNDEQLIRDVIGECFAPHHVKALLQSYIDCIVKKP